MRTIGFPTPDFAAPLPFTIDVPDNWVGIDVGGTLLAAAEPQCADGRERASVVVVWHRVPVDADIKRLAVGLAAECQDPVIESEVSRETGGLDAARLRFATGVGDDEQRRDVQLVLGPPIGRSRDLYQVVARYSPAAAKSAQEARAAVISFALAVPIGGN